ncbi:MAG: CRTAC1 family protein [Acidimicrobiia bacterium]
MSNRERGASTIAWIGFGAIASLGAIGLWLLLTATLGSDEPAVAFEPPLFVEEASASGIDHIYDGDDFFVGGGVAIFDCNDDGRPDVYLAGGDNPAALYRNESSIGGSLEFSKVADTATELVRVTGAYPLDIDSDGIVDLAILRFGENVILRGLGDCQFEEGSEMLAFYGGQTWTNAFSARWEESNSLPTLAFGNYLALNDSGEREEASSQGWNCASNMLYRPHSDGRYYSDPLELSPSHCALSMLFSDWDRSGKTDLRVSNDKHYYSEGEEQLWRIEPGEIPALYTRDDGWNKVQIWGMGIASQDVTGDGMPEVFLTSQGDNKLQTLSEGASGPSFEDIAIRRGVTAHRPFAGEKILPSTAWHPEFEDVNNDGFIDLYISKGNVGSQPDYAIDDPNNLLLGQSDGSFSETAQSAGILNFGRTRGAAVVDLNLDGMLDLVEVNRSEPVTIWRNVGWGTPTAPEPMGNWLALSLQQEGNNSFAIGSWIEIRTDQHELSRETTIGGGHAGGQLGWIHFGLGTADRAEVRVQWPDGETGPWMKVDVNRFTVIDRDSSGPRVWAPTTD